MLTEHMITGSAATAAFKHDVRRFVATGRAERIETLRFAPTVKVVRLLAQLLTTESALEIERVSIDARSGCSDFRGTVAVATPEGERVFDFSWDCRWRAEENGWTDAFDFPDQARAAAVFGWKCFERWIEITPSLAS